MCPCFLHGFFYFLVRPRISVNCPSVTTVNQSDYFACECTGTGGNPLADVTWYKDGRNVSITRKEQATFVLPSIDKDDNGTYTCVARSEDKSNETSVEIIVSCKYY